MAFQLKDNSASAFPNSRKERDTHPDFTGSALIDGKNYWLNMWVKDGSKGEFFSFSFKPKDESGAPRVPNAAPAPQRSWKPQPAAQNKPTAQPTSQVERELDADDQNVPF